MTDQSIEQLRDDLDQVEAEIQQGTITKREGRIICELLQADYGVDESELFLNGISLLPDDDEEQDDEASY